MKNKTEEQQKYGLPRDAVIPEHIAIIMDGNGRWAKSKGLPRIAGHHAGVDSVREIVEVAAEIGVKYLTLYTFSTENWKRPKDEVSTLMTLLVRTLRKEINELHKNNVRLNTIGDFSMLPEKVQEEFTDAIERTAGNSRLNLNLALSYSGRWEIIEAVRKIAADAAAGTITPAQVNDQLFSSYLTTSGMPDPELLIRTSGEFRVSNFLLWQIAYSEIYICSTYWPEFRKQNLIEAILDFQKRERRFGKVSEQLQNETKRN
ncbi:MAG: isoprenyl transferase [Ignavibacteriales bacterium]|nr:Ditrans,polycis-undecaprenyl-diphosphate synthase ((2E,6E)-farnesyl-diphosphate specific) [Ignavibacteriaceae bacterium]MCK6615152.1 isoprenyl transferase [Ignavibacteriaceae bacterium]QOJ28468.1 MAG: isoprenyl transferase [Ignavibacteriales bacterium]